VISQEAWPMGTAGALRLALEHLDSDTILVLSGDTYVDTSLVQFREWQKSQSFPSAILLTWAENCTESGAVPVDPAGRILALGENRGVPQAGWVDSGVYLLSRAWLEALPSDTPLSLERDVLPFWIERGLGGYCVRAPYLDIGAPEGLARAASFFHSLGKKNPSEKRLMRALRA
jgi:NDP-sugar pyrophosphorylase family protein